MPRERSYESPLARRLNDAIEGDVLFSSADRGRYATDASIYQIQPLGVVVPKTLDDVAATLEVAREEGVPLLPRGGGTSQCGQTVNEAVVLDLSKHVNAIVEVDPEARTATVEPGLVLDHLNAALKPHGLWYPVDVSTSSRATIGGMTANNSCGSRSIRYGTSRHNVLAIDALLTDGRRMTFGPSTNNEPRARNDAERQLVADLLELGAREADEIRARFPDVIRRVGGYNIDALLPEATPHNLAELLVGSEGTLAFSERITLKLSPMLTNKVLGVCHFPTFHEAMDAAQHLVTLGPTAVELIDHNMIALGRDIPMFRPVVDRFVRGAPQALLVVEFAEPDQEENLRRLTALHELMAELGFLWGDAGKKEGGVVEAIDPEFQRQVIEVRKQGLNIMMSMKSQGKPISFVEDCAVELKDLAYYTDGLTAIFRKYGTDGTWYAHASVGTLHVRPVLNLKLDTDLKAMRGIAEEAFDLVKSYKGSHSGEHGDGIVRSEFHAKMFGERMVENFNWVKDRFDPEGLFNPGKIVCASKMDDRQLLRYHATYDVAERETVFAWPGHYGAGRGLQGAVEMCNNNGACRKMTGGVMCPSYRVTQNERDVVRGRANTLRLALSNQLPEDNTGEDAFAGDAMKDAMALCVSCKACRRECPMSVDMAKLKIEVQAARVKTHGLSLRDRCVGTLPRYAPWAARFAPLMNLRDRVPGLAALSERLLGFAASQRLPTWTSKPYVAPTDWLSASQPDVLFFADTFNRYFEPENLHAGTRVLQAACGASCGAAQPTKADGPRPLCCGRTFLSVGLADEAANEMRRTVRALRSNLERGATVVGLEPSCMMTFRDEAPVLLGDKWDPAWSSQFVLLEEYLAREEIRASLTARFRPLAETTFGTNEICVHGHCHQKAFDALSPTMALLGAIPQTSVALIDSSCCGMAGAFGYQAETQHVSRAMAELSLLPAVRAAHNSVIVADGTSCRHQIAGGAGRPAHHAVHVLDAVLS